MADYVVFLLIVSALSSSTKAGRYLDCYQCSSYMSDEFPLCDDYYWHVLDPRQTNRLITGCAENVSSFCLKKETNIYGDRYTERGCISSHDSNGIALTNGCTESREHGHSTYCFCDKSLCNLSHRPTASSFVISPLAAVYLWQSCHQFS